MGFSDEKSEDIFDIIIVGAGISGINAAYRIQTELPSARYTILEARGGIGGTWDLFRYPGFRSDSDLYTFGFAWRPWREQKIIADGDSIRNYIRESAALYGIDQKVKYHRKLVSANWSSDQQAWSLQVDEEGRKTHFHARFVVLGTGYYDYDEALSSHIPGIENFAGQVVHPQFWPDDLDYKDKKIIVVGSGSTAVTLIPSLAETASQVTMLQRSPTYIVSQPAIDPFGQWAQRFLPQGLAHRITRLKFLISTFLALKLCTLYPLVARNLIKKATLKQLPDNVPHDPHFSPRYHPWEQRLCLCPDGDFFAAMRAGKASVVTDTIDTVTATGIQLASGRTLDADIIVTATGLKLKIAGGAQMSADNEPVTISEKFLWKGVMLQDLPNTAMVIGYTNASWTLGADATALLVCRLLKTMEAKRVTSAVPRLGDGEGMEAVPALNLSSTYVVRGAKELPRTGDRAPWMRRSTYFSDLWGAKFGNITDGLHFESVST
ncbi:hypothetical protein IMSHALPRED_004317 [Imshaugia aleurites]|uniref:Monooxygenase n=1 Tax=Imshaugia aleurites TaxID=172621 RepID=A0A8H3F7J7_9LECA|nr:hypothetical protein IMSHALPRED_004317 [Imshaugia aleurites]